MDEERQAIIDAHVMLLRMAHDVVFEVTMTEENKEETVRDLPVDLVAAVYNNLVGMQMTKGAIKPQQKMAQEAVNILKGMAKKVEGRD